MKAWRGSAAALPLALAACIPQAAAPYRPAPPPDRRAPADDPYFVQRVPDEPPPRDDAPTRPDARDEEAPRQRGPERPRASDPDDTGRDAPQPSPERVPAPPAARPAWEARPVEPDAEDVSGGPVTVRANETLRQLGERTGAGAEAIARANDLSPPYPLRAGQRLDVPAGRYHLVRPGQSGIAIARAYGVPWARIVDANGLAEPYLLHVGQRVLIPGASADRPRSAAERAAAFTLDVDSILTGGEPALARNQAPAAPVATATRVLPSSAAVSAPARLRGGFIWPVDGRLVTRFGHGEAGVRNDGVGIAVPLGTPVKAAADGVVVYAGSGVAALGGLVILRHGDGWTTIYGYAGKLLVQRGQSVRRGQSVALSGDSGSAQRPELHFELRRGRTPVDPTTQLGPL